MVDISIDSLKMLRETLCVAESLFITEHRDYPGRDNSGHIARIGQLIKQIDIHRPLGVDGKHGNLHTDNCGCEDKTSFYDNSVTIVDQPIQPLEVKLPAEIRLGSGAKVRRNPERPELMEISYDGGYVWRLLAKDNTKSVTRVDIYTNGNSQVERKTYSDNTVSFRHRTYEPFKMIWNEWEEGKPDE